MSKQRKITVAFVVSEEDISEIHNTLYPNSGATIQHMLVNFIQSMLYDSDNGPMLEGQFNVIDNTPIDDLTETHKE